MPKVPQQPNFKDCGIFMLQYVESFFTHPVENYDTKYLNLMNWFKPSVTENKRKEIFNFIVKKVDTHFPQNRPRIPNVDFDPDPDEKMSHEAEDEDSEDLFEDVKVKRRKISESDDHNYAKGVTTVLVSSSGSHNTSSL